MEPLQSLLTSVLVIRVRFVSQITNLISKAMKENKQPIMSCHIQACLGNLFTQDTHTARGNINFLGLNHCSYLFNTIYPLGN